MDAPTDTPTNPTPEQLEALVTRFNAKRWRFWVTLILLGNHPLEAYKLTRRMP